MKPVTEIFFYKEPVCFNRLKNIWFLSENNKKSILYTHNKYGVKVFKLGKSQLRHMEVKNKK